MGRAYPKKPDNFEDLMQVHGGNKTAVAEEIGVSRWDVWRWAKQSKIVISPDVRKIRNTDANLKQLQQRLAAEVKRREAAEEDLAELMLTNEVLREVSDRTPVKFNIPSREVLKGNGVTAIICATDWHLEKDIERSTVSGLNEFNLDIAASRIGRLWEKSIYLVDFFRNIGKVNDAILWLGGDLIQNHLHDEDAETTNLGPAEAIALVQDHVATGIDHLSKNLKCGLRVVCNYGNHARTTKRQRHSCGWSHSWEWLAYETLAKKYKRIPFTIARGYMNYVQVQNSLVRFHHGEAVKYNGGIGGLQIPMNKALAAWDRSVKSDYSINGHYHTYKDEWGWTSCGCLCGYDAFAQSIKADFQPPTQTVIFIDSRRGKVASLPIFVDKV